MEVEILFYVVGKALEKKIAMDSPAFFRIGEGIGEKRLPKTLPR